jgi:23S rRNA pseudouridine2605 synthase
VRIRLQRCLAEAGLGSRRNCEDLIRAGRVTIEGKVAALGASVDPDTEAVAVDGRPLSLEAKEYWLLNKPKRILSAASDVRGRRTVVDCVPARVRVFPVGRLDLNSTGVLLLTNDGELAARLLHPRYHVDKEYRVSVHGEPSEGALAQLRRGVLLPEGLTSPAGVRVLGSRKAGGKVTTDLLITIHEGRKRQVRRMLEAVGHTVISLHRTRFAGLTDDGLDMGQARPLTADEVAALKEQAKGL